MMKRRFRDTAFVTPLHDGAGMRIVITEDGTSFLINNGGISWLLMVTKLFFIAAMLVVVVWRGRLVICIVSNCVLFLPLLLIIVLLVEVMGFRIVWVWPWLCSSSCLPHCFENFSLVCPSHNCYFLHIYVYIDIIHSCEKKRK